MQQHPVPQHIASYEFRLVGDMTLKQFLQVAGGGLIALLFYAAPLPVIIKWPLIFMSAVSGAALAFLPIEDRPLSAWFIAFLRAIYSPTQYAYQQGKGQDVFAPETEAQPANVPMAPGELYLNNSDLPQEQDIKKLEEEEQSFFQKALATFHLVKTPEPVVQPVQPLQPQTPIQPRPQMVVEQVGVAVQPVQQTVPASFPSAAPAPDPFAPPPVASPPAPNPFGSVQFTPQVVPASGPEPAQRRGPGRPRLTVPKYQILSTPPAPPRSPNIIVGQVLDSMGNTVEAAILEIKDANGRPVRALRTNKVGHFLTATALEAGNYEVITERDGFVSDPIQVSIQNQIIAPIEIRAKAQ